MKEMRTASPGSGRDIAFGGIFGASALLLPVVFHAFHLGSLFLPMYLPLVALAFFVRPAVAGLTALIVPALSGALTGMPPFYPPVAPVMSVELGGMALILSGAHRAWPKINSLALLVPTLIVGRVINGGTMYALSRLLDLPAWYFAGFSFFSGWPGLLLMVVVVPPLVKTVGRRRITRSTYQTTVRMYGKRAYFDAIASQWDSFDDPVERGERLRRALSGIDFSRDTVVLDIGCGTGTLSSLLSRILPAKGRIIALDLSPNMVETARKKVTDGRITWLVRDACATSLPAESVDRVICYSTWPHFDDPLRVAAEFHRVLKPGGMLHIIHTEPRSVINAIHRHAGEAVRHDHLPAAAEVAGLLGECGFRVGATVDSNDQYHVAATKFP